MEVKTLPKSSFEFAHKMLRIANAAASAAQAENRKLGLPNVYSINGIIVYELNGKITTENPLDNK
jgi:hypothetical protein